MDHRTQSTASLVRTREDIARRADEMFAAMQAGKFKLAVARIFPLEKAADADRLLQSRTTIGKVLLQAF